MDLIKAMGNLQEAKKANSQEIAKVAKILREKKSLNEGIIDNLQKNKPTEKRDASKTEINKAVKEDLDTVNSNRSVGMMSDEDQEKYYHDTYKDTNGTFYDVYKIDNKLYDVLGNEVQEQVKESCENCDDLEEKKNLTELRHVDKKKIVKAYDFTELDKERQDALIKEYFRYRNRDDSKTPKDFVINNLNDQFKSELEGTFFKPKSIFSSSDKDITPEKVIEDGYFYTDITLDKLSPDLAWDSDYYKSVEVSGSLSDKWTSIRKEVLDKLSKNTNYDELPKATKKEIISKINDSIEKLKELITVYCDKAKKDLEEAGDSISDFEKLKNKPAIDELTKYWYTEQGIKIVSKSNAKVIEGEVNESLITEAPVNLEIDNGYDVYSYDDLDDRGKANAFNSTERSRKNEYERKFNILTDNISKMVNEELSKLGLKLKNAEEPLQIRSYNKGELDYVDIHIDPASLVSYAKSNGIELNPVSKILGGEKEPSCLIALDKNRQGNLTFAVRLNYINAVDVDKEDGKWHSNDWDDDEEVRKELSNELELDLKGLKRKIERIHKQFKDSIDDDYRNRMSTDKKLKRREYDSMGNIYRDKDKEN